MAQEVRSCSICSICSNALSEQEVCCLACGHVFHNSCIEGYLQTKDECPYSCRFPENEPAIRKLYIDEDPAHNEGEVYFN
ncbi:ring finger domain-containing protein [Ditylenchus destructor]|nr:ring finger domain-containing protein [Ditylenchus destructor]